jgi:hypothetical protein
MIEMETDNYIDKETLIECLKTLPIGKDKNIIDVQDIKRLNNELWEFSLITHGEYELQEISFHNTIKNDTYDSYRLKQWYDKNWKGITTNVL